MKFLRTILQKELTDFGWLIGKKGHIRNPRPSATFAYDWGLERAIYLILGDVIDPQNQYYPWQAIRERKTYSFLGKWSFFVTERVYLVTNDMLQPHSWMRWLLFLGAFVAAFRMV